MKSAEQKIEEHATRNETRSSELSEETRQDFEISSMLFGQLTSNILEIRRRFQNLSKEGGVEGVPMIEGCKTFDEWCWKVLHKPKAVVLYLLRGGPKSKPPKEDSGEVRALKFTKEEREMVALLFRLRLPEEPTKQEKEALLHQTFGAYLAAITAIET